MNTTGLCMWEAWPCKTWRDEVERLTAELAALRHDMERGAASHSADLAELVALRADAEIGRIVRRRLVSGNDIPVSRAYVTAQEVHDIDAKVSL